MKVEIVSYSNKYSKYFYELNYDWLNEFFYVEEYDELVLRNCKSEIIDKGGYIFFALNNSRRSYTEKSRPIPAKCPNSNSNKS